MKETKREKSMNAKLLDSQLRKLTDEEIEARDGKRRITAAFSSLRTVEKIIS